MQDEAQKPRHSWRGEVTAAAYYNEINPEAARVLREQIARGVIAPGEVDTRSIKDVQPDDLRGFSQLHFFAGGGLWSVAARLAGWPDDKPLWTGSCPCQGESLAGKRLGADDPRHLWPDFYRLIRARRPAVVVGEQVAAAAGTHWLDGVCADLANENYAARAVDIPACSVDAPHQRQRLYWIAVDDDERRGEGRPEHELRGGRGSASGTDALLQPDADRGGCAGRAEGAQRRSIFGASTKRAAGGLCSDAASAGRNAAAHDRVHPEAQSERPRHVEPERLCGPPLRSGSFWSDYEWIVSPLDGKARRTKPGIPFLVNGLPGRVDLWRIGGNAVVPILAAEVLKAYLETENYS